jgi:hypothetical protein
MMPVETETSRTALSKVSAMKMLSVASTTTPAGDDR